MKLKGTNSLGVSGSSSFTLNFLVFLQNAVLNRNRETGLPPRFPYHDTKAWCLILDDKKFIERFRESWAYAIDRLSVNGRDFGEDDVWEFCHELFDGNKEGFMESYYTFVAWWSYGEGAHSTSSRINELTKPIYDFVCDRLQPLSEDKRLRVWLIYDDLKMADELVLSWFVILSVPEIEKIPFIGLTDTVVDKILKAIRG